MAETSSIRIAAMTFRLHAPWVHSLKEKRMIVKSVHEQGYTTYECLKKGFQKHKGTRLWRGQGYTKTQLPGISFLMNKSVHIYVERCVNYSII